MSEESNLYTFENETYRKTYWHTCSHVMAQAVKRLWPEVRLAIGPSIDEGWYYDMDAPFAFTPEHLEQIEGEMRKICKEKLKLERFELPRAEALAFMEEKGEPSRWSSSTTCPRTRPSPSTSRGSLPTCAPAPTWTPPGGSRATPSSSPPATPPTGGGTAIERPSSASTAWPSPKGRAGRIPPAH